MRIDDDAWCDDINSMNSVVVLIVHFLADFLFGCNGREGECLFIILIVVGREQPWPTPMGQAFELCISRVIGSWYKGNSDVWKQSDWPGCVCKVCKWSLVYLQVKKLLWSFLLTQFFSNAFCRVSIFFFLLGTVTRVVKSGNGRTGRNAITFRSISFCDGKMLGNEGELKGLHYFPRSQLVRDPPLVKVNKIPCSVLHL